VPTVIAHRGVKDVEQWLAHIRTLVDPQNPNRVALVMDVPDNGSWDGRDGNPRSRAKRLARSGPRGG
jgi:hypothetical protein